MPVVREKRVANKVLLRPIRDQIVVRVQEPDEMTPGGIVLPDASKEKPTRGVVQFVGSGHLQAGQTVPLEIAVGDEVVFGRYSGTAIQISGEDFTVIREQDVLAVMTPYLGDVD